MTVFTDTSQNVLFSAKNNENHDSLVIPTVQPHDWI